MSVLIECRRHGIIIVKMINVFNKYRRYDMIMSPLRGSKMYLYVIL